MKKKKGVPSCLPKQLYHVCVPTTVGNMPLTPLIIQQWMITGEGDFRQSRESEVVCHCLTCSSKDKL